MKNRISFERVCLGTANFGLEYGLKNGQKMLGDLDIKEILRFAVREGISTFDSAIDYGTAHLKLKDYANANNEIITKINIRNDFNIEDITRQLRALSNFGCITLLIHNPHQMTKIQLNQSIKILQDLKNADFVNKIGLSLYDYRPLALINEIKAIDCVQYPVNCFDNRMEKSGWSRELSSKGVKQIARSIFLQGVLLVQLRDLPEYFTQWSEVFQNWDSYLKDTRQTAYKSVHTTGA